MTGRSKKKPWETKRKPLEIADIKPKKWQMTGWCSPGRSVKAVGASHARCKGLQETPSVLLHCSCLCHLQGLLEAVQEAEALEAKTCGVCAGLGRPVKSKTGELFWKCAEGHRWARTK